MKYNNDILGAEFSGKNLSIIDKLTANEIGNMIEWEELIKKAKMVLAQFAAEKHLREIHSSLPLAI